MTLEIFIAIILFLVPLAYSPGPGNMFFTINGARFGYKNTLWASFGYHFATWIVTYVLGVIYLNGVVVLSDYLFLLKYIGSVYVVYLSYKLFRTGGVESIEEPKPIRFIDGALLLLLNPKAYVIILLLFTQFLTVFNDTKYTYLFILTTIFTVNNFIAFSLFSIFGDIALKKFRNPQNAKKLNKIFGVMLFIVGLWIALG